LFLFFPPDFCSFLQKAQIRAATANHLHDANSLRRFISAAYMSSEESGEDVLSRKTLPWRSEELATYLHGLDAECHQQQSDHAKRLYRARRETTMASSHVAPRNAPQMALRK